MADGTDQPAPPPEGGAPAKGPQEEQPQKAVEGVEPKGNGGQPAKPGGMENMFYQLGVPLIVIFAVMYFIMIRPQKKKEAERKALLAGVRVNDDIITIGGIHGTVTAVKENEVIIRTEDKAKLRLNRSAVAHIVRKDD